MNNKEVLYLSYDGMTDPLGQSQVLPYVAGLSEKGLNFTIISFEKSIAFKHQQKIIKKIVDENNIRWIPLKYTKRPPFIATLYDIYKFKKIVSKEIEDSTVSLIHCRSYISALIGLWAKRKYNIPFIFDMRGFWADERVDGKIWDLNNAVHKKAYHYFKKKEKEFLQESSGVISLTHMGKQEIESWKLAFQTPIEVIPCCTDEQLFNIDNVNKNVRLDLNISSKTFVLSYLGSIGTWYMLDEMLDFFKELLVQKNDAKFLFITKDDEIFIKDKAREKDIPKDKIVVTSSNRQDVPSFIKASNASIFFIKPVYSKKASSPTKMGEIMNLGVPIVCNSGVGDVDIVMNETMPEFIIHEFKKSDYQKTINELLANDKRIDTEKIIQTSNSFFSLKNGVEKYYSVYQSILNLK